MHWISLNKVRIAPANVGMTLQQKGDVKKIIKYTQVFSIGIKKCV